jgi:hypothetical protein
LDRFHLNLDPPPQRVEHPPIRQFESNHRTADDDRVQSPVSRDLAQPGQPDDQEDQQGSKHVDVLLAAVEHVGGDPTEHQICKISPGTNCPGKPDGKARLAKRTRR